MASRRILALHKVFSSNLKRSGFTRAYSNSTQSSISSSPEQLESRVKNLSAFVMPAIAALQTTFFAPGNHDIHYTNRAGSGIFVEPNLILTSAHIVAHVAAFHVSKPVGENISPPSSEFEQHGCICHKSYIGDTIALTTASKTGKLKLTPLAVNFRSDLAVLKVTDEDQVEISPRRCAVVAAKSPTVEDDILFGTSLVPGTPDCIHYFMYGTFRSMGEKTVRSKAPWPLDDDEGKWMELNIFKTDGFTFPHGHPPPRVDCSRGRKITGNLLSVDGGKMGGITWFNLHGEVVGILSWAVIINEFIVGYAAPYLCIKDVLDYAKGKGPEDSVVMDRWIDSDGVV